MLANQKYRQGKVNYYNSIIPPETGKNIVLQAVQAQSDHRIHNTTRRLISSLYNEASVATLENSKIASLSARLSEIQAIYNEVQKKIKYTYDPHKTELVYHPSFLYDNAFSKKKKWAEDCDTIALLTLTYLLSLGYKSRVTIVGFPSTPGFAHVFAEAFIPELSRWLVIDPALGVKSKPMVKRIVRFQHFYP